MITKEIIATWVAKNKSALFLMSCVILGQVLLHFTSDSRSARIIDEYITRRLAGRVDTIPSYSRGFPKVQLSTGEKLLIRLPDAGQKYLKAGDSLVKESGTRVVTVYRRFPAYMEVSVFGGDRDSTDGEGLAKRYRIASKP
ncbi:hypothetical protein [Hymenobacter properus]|uniref:Uncharacterized protein n=1 Tax=Hymenobacter properus TaxID=2791026 RepID=A0A931BMK7_9BACT|nr:hypothetical protein [Hymenobacter properus]MBF9144202.1 hypothetical protein [Hymenobacter properus]MBR7723020.1 hypothetical protein [Microvirga sp. SRT04]